jgi:hypothetical protein
MITPQQIEQAIQPVSGQGDFFLNLLAETLGWPIQDKVQEIEEISYGWTADDLRAQGLEKHLLEGGAWQIQPFRNDQPWGIFLLEFKNPEVFTARRGMVGPLRKVLRGLVPSRRRQSHLPTWKRENLLFISTHKYQHFRFAYFKAPAEGTKTAPLAAFGWERGDSICALSASSTCRRLPGPRTMAAIPKPG